MTVVDDDTRLLPYECRMDGKAASKYTPNSVVSQFDGQGERGKLIQNK